MVEQLVKAWLIYPENKQSVSETLVGEAYVAFVIDRGEKIKNVFNVELFEGDVRKMHIFVDFKDYARIRAKMDCDEI